MTSSMSRTIGLVMRSNAASFKNDEIKKLRFAGIPHPACVLLSSRLRQHSGVPDCFPNVVLELVGNIPPVTQAGAEVDYVSVFTGCPALRANYIIGIRLLDSHKSHLAGMARIRKNTEISHTISLKN
jgi:hypothetical protein